MDSAFGPVGDSIKLSAARGEAEAFQIAAGTRKKELKDVQVIVEHARDKNGMNVCDVEVNVVGYIETIIPSGFRIDFPIGRYPDPLLRTQKSTIPLGENRTWWITVRVANEAKPGNYQEKIKILSEGRAVAELPYELMVYNFELPQQANLKTAFGCWADRMTKVLSEVGYRTLQKISIMKQ